MRQTRIVCDRCGGGGAKVYGVSGSGYVDASGNYDEEYEAFDLCQGCIKRLEMRLNLVTKHEYIDVYKEFVKN